MAQPRYCHYHRRVLHSTDNCYALRRIFQEKAVGDKTLEITNKSIHVDPLPRHDNDGRSKALMVISHYDEHEEVGLCEQSAHPEGQRENATEGECVEVRFLKKVDSNITFSSADRAVPYPHNRPLYLPFTLNSVEFQRALVDTGASINVISTATIRAAGIPDAKIQRKSIDVRGFGGHGIKTLGHIQLDIAVGPLRSMTRFHVIDEATSYQAILGRPWCSNYGAVPSPYHQCLKALWKGKVVTVKATQRPFRASESHFEEAVLFGELQEEEQPLPLRGTPLPTWDECVEGSASTANTVTPCNKRLRVTKFRRSDGKMVYRI